jgi:hypothetical protein
MGTTALENADIASDAWRYFVSLNRALSRERTEFMDSCMIAAEIAFRASRQNRTSWQQLFDIAQHNQELVTRGMFSTQEKLASYQWDKFEEGSKALFNTLWGADGEKFAQFMRREADVMQLVANFSEQVEKIGAEFGFHFESRHYELIAETDCFLMYQVLPIKNGVTVRADLKPMLLVPPYMLGEHILAFLPHEDKSYAHAFANEGIPTYIRVVKDIWETEKVQTMTPEDDCLQTLELCRKLVAIHGQKMTLNGTCQGGYICLMNLLSGRFRDVCDTLITNVAPIDGTYSAAIAGMPQMHDDFILSTLPNGNQVANGYLLSLGMRFVAIDRETPLITVLNQAVLQENSRGNPGKTPAALYRWLRKERVHLPPAIAAMSSCTFQKPVGADGTLPVKLFGEALNLKELAPLGIRWYQNYAIKDDLVTPACATAGNKFLDGTGVVETVAFPGGHVAILTSPYAKKAPVNGTFVDAVGTSARGPVKFQRDVSAAPAAAPDLRPAQAH